MVTILDDCSLSEEERKRAGRLLELYPLLPVGEVEWVDVAPLKEKASAIAHKADAVVLVASGGLELYSPSSQPVFVFDSRVHGDFGGKAAVRMERFRKAVSRSDEYHADELEKLGEFFRKGTYSKVAVLEGEVGTAGVSVARLSAINHKLRFHTRERRFVIGVAYEGEFGELEVATPFGMRTLTAPNPLISSGLDYEVIRTASHSLVRRFSEAFYNEFLPLDEDTRKMREFLSKNATGESQHLLEDYISLRGRAAERIRERGEALALYREAWG